MKKLLALLFLSPLAYSQEYVFACETDEKTIATVVINTKEEFITLGSLRFDDQWTKEDIMITAVENNAYENENAIIRFYTVTGEMEQMIFKKGTGADGETAGDLFINQYNYLCKPTSRLIP